MTKLSLRDNFCSSPWFHLRINPAGYYIPCRWAPEWNPQDHKSAYNVESCSIQEYMNSDLMREFRLTQLKGQPSKICQGCYYEDQHHKLSGRFRQLLKSGITVHDFTNSFCSSPHFNEFEHSWHSQGHTTHNPTDLQIDLGNVCNSACIMCNPTYSSRLGPDYEKLTKTNPGVFPIYEPITNWADNDQLVEKFVAELLEIPDIKYIHFLGGETLYIKSFYKICRALIEAGMASKLIIGTTTNGTIYSEELAEIITCFKEFHLGVSIETTDSLNNYIRYPSDISNILANLDKFLELRQQTGLQISLRITPSVYTVYRLDTIFRYMLDHNVIAESCNILSDPSCLRIEILPNDLRQAVLAKIDQVITDYKLEPVDTIINRRRNDLISDVIVNNIFEYKNLLENIQTPVDVDAERYRLVEFTRAFENLRNNCILDHLPEYEEFLRSYGY